MRWPWRRRTHVVLPGRRRRRVHTFTVPVPRTAWVSGDGPVEMCLGRIVTHDGRRWMVTGLTIWKAGDPQHWTAELVEVPA